MGWQICSLQTQPFLLEISHCQDSTLRFWGTCTAEIMIQTVIMQQSWNHCSEHDLYCGCLWYLNQLDLIMSLLLIHQFWSMHCCYEIDIILHDIITLVAWRWEIKLYTRRKQDLVQSSTTSRKNDGRKLSLSFTIVDPIDGYYKRFDDALYLLLSSMQ